jgi:hypothetical protein
MDAEPLQLVPTENAMEEEREERRATARGRRDTDRNEGWRDPRFYIALAGFLLTCAVGFWTIARAVSATQLAVQQVSSIRQQLDGIDSKLNAMALSDSGQNMEIEFLKKELAEFKQQVAADKQLSETYITNTRERLVRLERDGGK